MNKKTRTYEALPLRREHMPTDYSISLGAYTGRGTPNEARTPRDFGPPQSLRGFAETYRNIIDYIVRITYRIWEDREVEYIRECYSPDSRVFDDYGLQIGNEKIVSDTHHTTGAFSNIELIADEIIWAGDDEVGFHTSHRTLIRGRNDGDSKYGPATGKDVDVLVIANCVALENDIFLEHVLYNTSGMLAQLGFDLDDQVRKLVARPLPGWPRDGATWDALRLAARPAVPISKSQPATGFDPDGFVHGLLNRIWNDRDFAALTDSYAPDFAFEGPTNRRSTGPEACRAFLGALFETFPDAALSVDEVYWMGNETEGFLVSARWSAEATHRGAGLYGDPSGRAVQIWGITQYEIRADRVTREWMLFNEFDLMMQIAAAKAS